MFQLVYLWILWIFTFVFSGAISSTESASLRFYHGSLLNYTVTPVEEPLRLLPYFNKTLELVFYIFGFNETADSEGARLIISAYLNRGNSNVLLMDWGDEARAPWESVALSYALVVAPRTRPAGRAFGRALVTYIRNGIRGQRIHLLGHSLGSHVAGYAGETVKELNLEVGRITGLDPAGPLFDRSNGLNPSAAKFVDAFHTNPGQFGISQSIGSVDFWANCGDSIQPGCPTDPETREDQLCSHRRSYRIYAEAVLSPTSIIAVKAENCISWRSGRVLSQIIYLGDLVDTNARGNFYFSTRSSAPFSKGRAGLVPNNSNSI